MQLTWSDGPWAQVISSIVQLAILFCSYSLQNIIYTLQLYNCTLNQVHRVQAKNFTLSYSQCWCRSGRLSPRRRLPDVAWVTTPLLPNRLNNNIPRRPWLFSSHRCIKWLPCPKPYHVALEKHRSDRAHGERHQSHTISFGKCLQRAQALRS